MAALVHDVWPPYVRNKLLQPDIEPDFLETWIVELLKVFIQNGSHAQNGRQTKSIEYVDDDVIKWKHFPR